MSSASKEPLIYWRSFYELISGLKATATEEYMSLELSKVEQQLLHGLNYFKQPASNKSLEKDGSDSTTKRPKDSKLVNLVKKLSDMIRLEQTQTWEVLSNYLLYAFRGPAESLKKILISECKVNAVLSDIFCFYYRERMFLLKSFSIIISNVNNGKDASCVYRKVLEKLSYCKIYSSLVKQLDIVRATDPPDNMNCSSTTSSSLISFWNEHNLLEQTEILKLMIIITPHIKPNMVDMDKMLNVILKSSSAKRPSVLSKYDVRKQSLLQSIWDLEVIHFIQLLHLSKLPAESIWCDNQLFEKLDNNIRQTTNSYTYQYDATGALLASWLLITYLSPCGSKDIESLRVLSITVKQCDPWSYFNKLLTSNLITDDESLSHLVFNTVYEVVFLTLSNFGLDFVKDEPSIYSLTATLVRDEVIADYFWNYNEEGLMVVLEEAEMWFPAVWKPALGILTALASNRKSDCAQVLERLECKLKYCQKQTQGIALNMAGPDAFYNTQPVCPLVYQDVVIPCNTKCSVTTVNNIGNIDTQNVNGHRNETNSTYIHWNITLPFWRIVSNDIKSLHIQMRESPDFLNPNLRDRVIALFKLSKSILKNSSVIRNDMILAIEEVFSIINKYCTWGRNSELKLLAACLEVSTSLIPLFPCDILQVFEPLKFLPQIDHVVMTHKQCVQGIHYHGNYIKTLLELVEVKSGTFSLLTTYLQFLHMLFKVEETKVSWASLAGLMFVLRDVFPHYLKWYYVDENEKVEIGWLCIQLLHMSLNCSQEELTPTQTTVPLCSDTNPTPSSGPTFNLMANSSLYSLLNKDAGLTLIYIVAIGEQRLFDMVEKFPSWNGGKSAVLVSTVHLALSVLNRIILYKGVQQDPNSLSPTEEEIYREPKETDCFHCVLNVASYIHHSFNPKLRVLACRLLTRFADNTRLSLMLCTGLEPYTIRDMFLQPLYSECESGQLKIAILQFIAKCIHRQASLAEAFLNVLELKECIVENREQEGDNSGVLTFALCVLDNEISTVTDPVYHATMQLLHALWLEQCSLVLSYLRMRKSFWENLCKPLFCEPREDVPIYPCILNILSTEVFWYGKEVVSNLEDTLKKFLSKDREYLLKWSLLCTNPSGLTLSSAKKRNKQSEELVVAWRELVVTIAKFLPDLISDSHKDILALHLLNGLSAEMGSLVNMNTIISLSETYVMLITIWKDECCSDKKEVALTQMIRIISQLSHHYTYLHPKVITNILAFSARLLDTGPCVIPHSNEVELLIKSVCNIMAREIDIFMNKCKEKAPYTSLSQQHFTLTVCLALHLKTLIEKNPPSMNVWISTLRCNSIIQRLITATAAALKNQIEPKLCMSMLEFLLALTNKEALFQYIDMFDLYYYIWENLQCTNTSYESQMDEAIKSEWKPVYCRGLDLVTFLLESSSCKIKTEKFDFIELHCDYLRELLKLLEVSNDEDDFQLVLSSLRLLRQVLKNGFRVTNSYGLLSSVKDCLKTVVNLLLHPNTIVSQCFGRSPRKLLQINQKPLDQKVIQKVKKAQIKFVEIYCECISVLGQNFTIDICDVIAADRMGIPPWALQPPIECNTSEQDLSTVLNAVNLFTKVLTKNVRAATPVFGSDDVSISLSKLLEVNHNDIRFALEISAHFLIIRILLISVDDHLTFREKQLFTRDLSSEVNILLEYARRVSVDPSLHMLSVNVKENDGDDRSSGGDDDGSEIIKSKPLYWHGPSASQNVDDTLDGIDYLEPSTSSQINRPSTSRIKSSSIEKLQDSTLNDQCVSDDCSTLPMDFLAFAAPVFQLVFKMSEK